MTSGLLYVNQVLIKIPLICNDEGAEHDEVKDDDAADLKSPELVLVILVLALHVAIPVHLDHKIHLKILIKEFILPKMILTKNSSCQR